MSVYEARTAAVAARIIRGLVYTTKQILNYLYTGRFCPNLEVLFRVRFFGNVFLEDLLSGRKAYVKVSSEGACSVVDHRSIGNLIQEGATWTYTFSMAVFEKYKDLSLECHFLKA